MFTVHYTINVMITYNICHLHLTHLCVGVPGKLGCGPVVVRVGLVSSTVGLRAGHDLNPVCETRPGRCPSTFTQDTHTFTCTVPLVGRYIVVAAGESNLTRAGYDPLHTQWTLCQLTYQ